MQKILDGVKVDFASMTLEDLEASRKKLRYEISKVSLDDTKTLVDLKHVLSNVDHQILMRRLLMHKHLPTS